MKYLLKIILSINKLKIFLCVCDPYGPKGLLRLEKRGIVNITICYCRKLSHSGGHKGEGVYNITQRLSRSTTIQKHKIIWNAAEWKARLSSASWPLGIAADMRQI